VANARRPHKSTQTDAAESTSCLTSSDAATDTAVETMLTDSAMAKCSCDAKKAFASLKDQLERDHQVEKNKAIRALEDKVFWVNVVENMFSKLADVSAIQICSWLSR
jgi:hypothetical protein